MAVAAHAWNGNLLLQAPRALAEVVRHAVARSGRALCGLLGEWRQVAAAREALGLAAAHRASSATTTCSRSTSARCASRPPSHAVTCASASPATATARASRAGAAPTGSSCSPIRRTTRSSTRAAPPSWSRCCASGAASCSRPAASRSRSRRSTRACRTASRSAACSRRRSIARAATRAAWSPARCSQRARDGATRSILFTGKDNAFARRAYLALGYRVVGDFGIVFF